MGDMLPTKLSRQGSFSRDDKENQNWLNIKKGPQLQVLS